MLIFGRLLRQEDKPLLFAISKSLTFLNQRPLAKYVKGLLRARSRYRQLHGLRKGASEGARVAAGADCPEGLYLDLTGTLL